MLCVNPSGRYFQHGPGWYKETAYILILQKVQYLKKNKQKKKSSALQLLHISVHSGMRNYEHVQTHTYRASFTRSALTNTPKDGANICISSIFIH
jgi:hypothetical protein